MKKPIEDILSRHINRATASPHCSQVAEEGTAGLLTGCTAGLPTRTDPRENTKSQG